MAGDSLKLEEFPGK